MSDGINSLPEGPPIHRRPLPVPPSKSGVQLRPKSMPQQTQAPCPPPRTESVEKWEPISTSTKASMRARPVITVLDARPMSEVGFREDNVKGPLPKSPLPKTTQPDVTIVNPNPQGRNEKEKPLLRRPPPPSRPPTSRHSMISQTIQDDDHATKPLPDPPRILGKPPRPLSMLSKLPSPRKKTLPDNTAGVDNEGFEEKNNRLNSLERDSQYKSKMLIDWESEINGNLTSNGKTIPDLLSNSAGNHFESQQDIDLLNNVKSDNKEVADNGENNNNFSNLGEKHRGIPVFPPGAMKNSQQINRGPPPPLPKKSPSVPNLNKMSDDATWSKLGIVNIDTGEAEKVPQQPVKREPRKPTIIRTNVLHSVPTTADKDEMKESENQGSTESSHSQQSVISGGVKVFPFMIPKSQSDHHSLSSSSQSDQNNSQSNISKSQPPVVKPKPLLKPKPSLKPKPILAPKPSKRPQSEILTSKVNVHAGEKTNVPMKKEPFQNELNALLEAKRKPQVKPPETFDSRNDEINNQIENNQPQFQTATKKAGPVKATYRPTIIRATVKQKEPDPVEEVPSATASSPLNKRFSSSCTNIAESGRDNMLSREPKETSHVASKDDLNYKPNVPSPQPRKRPFGPTIIRPRSTINLSNSSSDNESLTNSNDNMNNLANFNNNVQPRPTSGMPDILHDKKPPSRPGPPLPMAQSRRRSSTGSVSSNEIPSSPTPQKKAPPAKPPPPRPSSGPRRESLRRRSDTPQRPSAPSATRRRQSQVNTSTPHGVAIYDYLARHADELNFKSGDVIELLKEVDTDWYCGRFNGQEGIFPKNFVKVECELPQQLHEVQQQPVITAQPVLSQKTVKSPVTINVIDETDNAMGPHCIALHDYMSKEPGDLCFAVGSVIKLIEKVGEEWRKGELFGSTGLFPITYVDIIQDCPAKIETNKDTGWKEEKIPQQNIQSSSQGERLATALYDFNGQENELTFKGGDQIHILSAVNDDWLYGEVHGQCGNFPANFISHIPDNLPPYSINIETSTHDEHLSSQTDTLNHRSTSPQPTLQTATVLYDFPGQTDEDLPLVAGQTVQIVEKVGDEWLKGRLGSREGMFPATFVEVEC